jgi:hypothetical protein
MSQKPKKISQLPSAVTILGDDYWIIDQNNVSKKATINQLIQKVGSSAGSIELRKTSTALQWKHAGDLGWQDLISLDELSGSIKGGAWSATFAYAKGDVVSLDDDTIYVSQQDNNTNHPVATDDGTWWVRARADAVSIYGYSVSTTAPADKQALLWDAATSSYVPGSVVPDINENSVDVQINNDNIQWQFNGGSWYNLISLKDIRDAAVPEMSFFTGNGTTKVFGPVPGLTSINPNRSLVVVGGVTQQPTVSYTLSLDNGGKLIFDEAPPTVPITIQPY